MRTWPPGPSNRYKANSPSSINRALFAISHPGLAVCVVARSDVITTHRRDAQQPPLSFSPPHTIEPTPTIRPNAHAYTYSSLFFLHRTERMPASDALRYATTLPTPPVRFVSFHHSFFVVVVLFRHHPRAPTVTPTAKCWRRPSAPRCWAPLPWAPPPASPSRVRVWFVFVFVWGWPSFPETMSVGRGWTHTRRAGTHICATHTLATAQPCCGLAVG